MIRQWTIIGALALALAALSWNFAERVLLYDPAEGFAQSGQATEASEAPGAVHKKAWGREIMDRNLFNPNRKTSRETNTVTREVEAPQQIARDVVVAPEPMPVVTLSGIIKNPDGSYTAYIKVGANPLSGVRVGDLMHEISVNGIEERRVELDWRGNSISLSLQGSPLMKKR